MRADFDRRYMLAFPGSREWWVHYWANVAPKWVPPSIVARCGIMVWELSRTRGTSHKSNSLMDELCDWMPHLFTKQWSWVPGAPTTDEATPCKVSS